MIHVGLHQIYNWHSKAVILLEEGDSITNQPMMQTGLAGYHSHKTDLLPWCKHLETWWWKGVRMLDLQ